MNYQSPRSPIWDSFETILGLPFRSLKTNNHLDVVPVEWHRVYYMGEGGGFPRVRVVVSQVSQVLPMACLSTKGAPECELTNLLVGLMQVRVNESFVPLPSLIPKPQHAPLLLLVLRAGSVPQAPNNSAIDIPQLILSLTRSLGVSQPFILKMVIFNNFYRPVTHVIEIF